MAAGGVAASVEAPVDPVTLCVCSDASSVTCPHIDAQPVRAAIGGSPVDDRLFRVGGRKPGMRDGEILPLRADKRNVVRGAVGAPFVLGERTEWGTHVMGSLEGKEVAREGIG